MLKRSQIENFFVRNNYGTIKFLNVKKSPHIISVSLNAYDAEDFLIAKNKEFAASTGSACNSNVVLRSHVLKAIKTAEIERILRISIN
jgi:cysteine desulfurase